MTGETELMDYDDMKIDVVNTHELDQEIQDIINKELLEAKYGKGKHNTRLLVYPGQLKTSAHYRCAEFKPSRKVIINQKNNIIRHRNKLVRNARENGKFYLEGGVLSYQ